MTGHTDQSNGVRRTSAFSASLGRIGMVMNYIFKIIGIIAQSLTVAIERPWRKTPWHKREQRIFNRKNLIWLLGLISACCTLAELCIPQ